MKASLTGKEAIEWKKMAGRECNFKNPHTPSPHKERGTIQGTNGLTGNHEQIIITDRAANRVSIPMNMAGIMIELLQE